MENNTLIAFTYIDNPMKYCNTMSNFFQKLQSMGTYKAALVGTVTLQSQVQIQKQKNKKKIKKK